MQATTHLWVLDLIQNMEGSVGAGVRSAYEDLSSGSELRFYKDMWLLLLGKHLTFLPATNAKMGVASWSAYG